MVLWRGVWEALRTQGAQTYLSGVSGQNTLMQIVSTHASYEGRGVLTLCAPASSATFYKIQNEFFLKKNYFFISCLASGLFLPGD